MGRRYWNERFFNDDAAPPRELRRRRRVRESGEELLCRLAARHKLEEMWEAKRLKCYLSDVFAEDPGA